MWNAKCHMLCNALAAAVECKDEGDEGNAKHHVMSRGRHRPRRGALRAFAPHDRSFFLSVVLLGGRDPPDPGAARCHLEARGARFARLIVLYYTTLQNITEQNSTLLN